MEPTGNTSSSQKTQQLDQGQWSWAGGASKITTAAFCTGCLCYMTVASSAAVQALRNAWCQPDSLVCAHVSL